MKGKIYTAGGFLTLAILTLGGCSASFSTNGSMNKPATNTNAPANKAANTNVAKKDESKAPTAKLQDAEKPEGEKGKAAGENVEIPKDWIDVYDAKKGYSFSLPDGSTGEMENLAGVDVFTAKTPAPTGLDIFVISYKDKTMTKEALLADAVGFLEGLGQKVTPGALKAESDDYSVADATTVLEDGRKGKLRILVGTDVTDNYIMILGTDTEKFAANEKIIDEIWGSFEMWSGGASNN